MNSQRVAQFAHNSINSTKSSELLEDSAADIAITRSKVNENVDHLILLLINYEPIHEILSENLVAQFEQ